MTDPTQTTAGVLSGIKIREGGALMLPGHAVWLLQGKPVWMGALDQPTEDVVYDEMILHVSDIAKLEGVASYDR